jgi:hypothetical protein
VGGERNHQPARWLDPNAQQRASGQERHLFINIPPAQFAQQDLAGRSKAQVLGRPVEPREVTRAATRSQSWKAKSLIELFRAIYVSGKLP